MSIVQFNTSYSAQRATGTADAIVTLGKELKRIADDGSTISGKHGGLDDDLAMALFLAVYW